MLRLMESSGELLSIGRFARQAGLSVRRLRRYHDLGLLEPALVDSESGYRYYSSTQVARGEAIAVLRSLDVPLAEIRRLLADPSDGTVASVLGEHRHRLEARLAEARDRLSRLDDLNDERRWVVVPDVGEELVEVRLDSIRRGAQDLRDNLVLVEVGGQRSLSIWIGPSEADSINLHLDGNGRERPMPHDLMVNLLRPFDIDVARVVISAFENQIYHAELHVRREGKDVIVDARPSDAVSLAVRTGAPMFVAAPVFKAQPRLELPPDAVHYELLDAAGAKLLQGWAVSVPALGMLEVHGYRGQVTTYEILKMSEIGERRVRGVARLISQRQMETNVPN